MTSQRTKRRRVKEEVDSIVDTCMSQISHKLVQYNDLAIENVSNTSFMNINNEVMGPTNQCIENSKDNYASEQLALSPIRVCLILTVFMSIL